MSVVGMLSLSFVYYIKIHTPRVYPFAYADNWSFMSTSERSCFQTMTNMLNFITDLRIRIDFSKSWCWATTKQFRTFWHDAAALLMDPHFVFTIKSHVHDLGCTISYTNQVVLGPLRDKIDNAVAKCNRLRKLQLPLDERAEKIQTAIWPATFYGALGVSIGSRHFVTLRRAACNVLVGDHKYASSPIAMHFLSAKVQDPLLYLVSDMLSTLRRLFAYYPTMAHQIITTIRTFEGKVRGPASALAAYLRSLGWELTQHATLLGPGGLRVNIATSSTKQIKSQLRIAWDWFCHQEIIHRKGAPDTPFDSLTTLRLMQPLTDRQRRILCLSITSGWQSLGAISGWSATQDPHCPFCGQYDTHSHQLLECSSFQSVRTEHPHAVAYIAANRRTLWFPLPCHHPRVELVRQAMHLRCAEFECTPTSPLAHHAVVYTDGTCDHPKDPYAARAAWAAVLRTPTLDEGCPYRFQIFALGHCVGMQTTNRSELFAIVVAAEQIVALPFHSPVDFITDSQFVIQVIERIESRTSELSQHKQAHWDLIRRLLDVWDPDRFHVYKIKSHMDVQTAQNAEQAWHIHGNAFADQAAARIRNTDDSDFTNMCEQIRTHYHANQHDFGKIYQFLLAIAHKRMELLEEKKPSPTLHAPEGHISAPAVDVFQNQIHKLKSWCIQGIHFTPPPEPHRVVFWCCSWGVNLCYLVWQFSTRVHWPDPANPSVPGDPGISWTELALSFMLWANQVLPIRIKEGKRQVTLQYTDPKVRLLPLKAKSLRVLSESFRWIIKHIQTFSRTKVIPAYKKQGTSSLTRLGFTNYHEGGLSRRPELPNAVLTTTVLHKMLQTMPHDPPFHNEIEVPELPSDLVTPPWPGLSEVPPDKQEAFTQHVRYAMFRHKDFDTIRHPSAPN